MKVPEPRKLSSGKWFIQLRLGGESISVSHFDKAKCIKEAQALKAEYLAGKRKPAEPVVDSLTLKAVVERFIEHRTNILSPSSTTRVMFFLEDISFSTAS